MSESKKHSWRGTSVPDVSICNTCGCVKVVYGLKRNLMQKLSLYVMHGCESSLAPECVSTLPNGRWVPISGNERWFAEIRNRNCWCRFDDSTICRYWDQVNPEGALLTHFFVEERCEPDQGEEVRADG